MFKRKNPNIKPRLTSTINSLMLFIRSSPMPQALHLNNFAIKLPH